MKKLFVLSVVLLFIGCDVFKLQEKINFDDEYEDSFNPVLGAESYSYIPSQLNVVIGTANTGTPHTVSSISGFYILKTEVTYKLWYAVKKWADVNGYSIYSAGTEGTGSEGVVPTSGVDLPVTNITWRDAIVWCNAYSEYCGLTPVYYTDSIFQVPMRTSSGTGSIDDDDGGADNPFLIKSATGFRLPTEVEWEYAARRQVSGTLQSGDYPSGALTNSNFSSYCWYSTSVLHNVAKLLPNAMGLYDMSGNVAEFCWDWHDGDYIDAPPYTDDDTWGSISGSVRVVRGGSYLSVEDGVRASNRDSCSPWTASKSTGFRIVKGSAP